jgi:hypothetical protein
MVFLSHCIILATETGPGVVLKAFASRLNKSALAGIKGVYQPVAKHLMRMM